MLADQIEYVALVSHDPDAAARSSSATSACRVTTSRALPGRVPVFALGRSGCRPLPAGPSAGGGGGPTGRAYIALAVDDLEGAVSPGRRPARRLPTRRPRRASTAEASAVSRGTRRWAYAWCSPSGSACSACGGPVERIDHVGVASADVREDEACSAAGSDSDREPPDRHGGLDRRRELHLRQVRRRVSLADAGAGGRPAVTFITVGDCDLEFLANFDPRQVAR